MYKYLCLLMFLTSCSTGQLDQEITYKSNYDSRCEDDPCGQYDEKVLVCHTPPGNEENAQTLCISKHALKTSEHAEDECGECPPACEDGVCHSETEDCETCPQDCGECPPECGNFICEDTETCADCVVDCGSCPPPCGDGVCAERETCEDCPCDCGECPQECPNEACESSESCKTCPFDCGECPPVCRNGRCETGESCVQCPGDCGFCPDDPIKPEIPQFGVRGGGCSAGKNYGNGLFVLIIMFVGLLLFRKYAKFLLILAILIAPSAVYAQNFNSERFEPGAGSDSILSVETGTTDPEGSMGSYLWLNVSDDPLVFENLNTEERIRKFVNYKAMVGFGFNYSPHDLLQFNVAVPFVMSQEATSSLTDTTMDIDAALGDVSVTPKFMLLRGNLPVALSAKLTLPTASSDNFVGSSDFSISPMLATSFSLNRWRTALNIGYRTRDDSQFLDLSVGDEMFAALGLAYGWGNGSEVGATLSAAVGSDNPFGKANQNYAEGMLGYRRFLTPDVSWFMGVGRGLSEGFGSPDWRGVVGLRISYDNTKNDVIPVPPKPVPEPEPVPQPKPEPTPAPEAPIKLVIPHTYFNFDKAEIRNEYKQLLLDFAKSATEYMSKYPNTEFNVAVVGSTDSIGSKEYNYQLGYRRAKAVALILVEGGISAKILWVRSQGERDSRDSNSTRKGRANNRNVLVWISDIPEAVLGDNEPTPETYDNF